MNAPDAYKTVLKHHIATIEAERPLKIIGLLPSGTIGHPSGEEDVEFLAEKREGLSLLGLTGAEVDLSERLGKPVRIVLRSELSGRDAVDIPAQAQPL